VNKVKSNRVRRGTAARRWWSMATVRKSVIS
jgi:hypothetical protein